MEDIDYGLEKEKKLNVVEKLIGLEVINGSGNLLGVVKDIVWDFESNRIEAVVVEEKAQGLLSRIGSGEKQFISYERIHAIGDKVLVDAEDIGTEINLDSYRLRI